jgi:hypothetical protein
MPSKKVRRRRQKLKRHEYEYVVETDEGEEIPVERPAREREDDGRAAQKGPIDRRGRPVPKPTFQRSLRRTAIFAPLIFLFVFLDPLGGGRETTTQEAVFSTVVILAFFLPFSYFVDRLIYNALTRRQQRATRR